MAKACKCGTSWSCCAEWKTEEEATEEPQMSRAKAGIGLYIDSGCLFSVPFLAPKKKKLYLLWNLILWGRLNSRNLSYFLAIQEIAFLSATSFFAHDDIQNYRIGLHAAVTRRV